MSNEEDEVPLPLLKKINISEKIYPVQPELLNLLLLSQSPFFQQKNSLENEQACGLRNIIPMGARSIQRFLLPALPHGECGQKIKAADCAGLFFALELSKFKAVYYIIFFSANHKSTFHL